MRISDWSSDVCSSDLSARAARGAALDAVPDRDSRADLLAGRNHSGADHRPLPRHRRAIRAGGRTPTYSLAIWHGFSLPLLMSVIALVGGTGLYLLFGARLTDFSQSPLIGDRKSVV